MTNSRPNPHCGDRKHHKHDYRAQSLCLVKEKLKEISFYDKTCSSFEKKPELELKSFEGLEPVDWPKVCYNCRSWSLGEFCARPEYKARLHKIKKNCRHFDLNPLRRFSEKKV